MSNGGRYPQAPPYVTQNSFASGATITIQRSSRSSTIRDDGRTLGPEAIHLRIDEVPPFGLSGPPLRGYRDAPDSSTLSARELPLEDGTPLHPYGVLERFQTLTAAAGLRRCRLHDLRHSWATAALEARIQPKVVQELLGHANIATTTMIYQHSIPALQVDATERVA